MNQSSIKKYVAEFIGTLVLVLFGCGTAMLLGPGRSTGAYLMTALAFGLSIVAMAYSVGNISGCHVNPAVSLGVFLSGGMNLADFIGNKSVCAVGGSWVCKKDDVLDHDWDKITALAANAVKIIKETRA